MDNRMRLESLHQTVSDNLEFGVIPFWMSRGRDPEYGGYLCGYNEAGESTDQSQKYLNVQCRQLWFFSRVYRMKPKLTLAKELAREGADFITKWMWDSKQGGFFWKTDRDGSKPDTAKITYGQSFAIYAFAEYALATGDERGLEYASQTFDLLQKYAADTLHGGYLENLEQDWSAAPKGFAAGDRKSLDVHMHLMEAFTTLYAVSKQEIHRCKLIEVIDLIHWRMIDSVSGCGLNQFDLSFKTLPAISIKRTWNAERYGERPAAPMATTSYGHNVELFWLMCRALETAGVETKSYETKMRGLLDHACTHGVDWQHGGIYRDGLPEGEALILEKEFWQHAESLVGFISGFQIFGDERYLNAFEAVWRFVTDHLIVPGLGEWRILTDRQGNPLDTDLGNNWKASYHTGRSMIECASILMKLLQEK